MTALIFFLCATVDHHLQLALSISTQSFKRKKTMAASSTALPQPQIFINFRGKDLRCGFVSHLVRAFKRKKINVFIDEREDRGQPLDSLFKRIEGSTIALAVFSENYPESRWCLQELEKMNERMVEGNLVVIPIFYKVEPSTVRYLKGNFGDKLWIMAKGDEKIKKWEEALRSIPNLFGITVDDRSDAGTSSGGDKHKAFGVKLRLKELEDMLGCDKYKGTRIIGVVGMPGIGKTTLMKALLEKLQFKFMKHALVENIRAKSEDPGLDYLPTLLLEDLLGVEDPFTDNVEDPYETYKPQLLRRKVLVILDGVSQKEQIDALLRKGDWISEGSRIVIATSDISLINGLVHDTYMVQNLDHRDSLELFNYHAFGDAQANPPNYTKLREEALHYARGHPLALKMLGRELKNQSMAQWKSSLEKLAQSPIPDIGSVFQMSYDELSSEQKDAFLDIACFRSENVDYVESLLASPDPGSAEAMSAVKALTHKFLINTCDSRVEMHDLLYTFSRDLDSKASTQYGNRKRRLCLHQDIIKDGVINAQNKMQAANVRGIFLDLSEVKGETILDCDHFIRMVNLRYLKFYNSQCPQECKTNNKINIPDKLKLPLKEVRCLHWLKFPLEELPNDFNPVNLVDLKLPFSEIRQLWKGDKDTPFLKWVDLSHSSKLCSLSGLLKAIDLQRLDLEGCTALKTLPGENLEILYLDGTAISQLPENMEKLQRLVVLNMKSCKMLQKVPVRVGELKALQELILSDCLNLNYFPEIRMSSLNILLLDGTAIEVMPQLPSVQYLCLSRNDKITCLPTGISQLVQLKWLDLKYCKSLTSVPEFPPNLQCLDAHGCSSLKTVSKPLARIMRTEQNPSTFIFTNCKNLEQSAKEEITSYAQRKCQLLSYARKRYNGGLVSEALFSTCFPGCEVPSWFCHERVGSELEVKLLPHWHDKRLAEIALCAVVSFHDCKDQISCLSVTCTFKVKVEDNSWVSFTCPVGSWTRQGDKVDSDHVFIGYTSCPYTMKCPEDENSDKCSSTEACLEFTVTGGTNEKGTLKVLKCGLGLVYAKDKIKNSSHEAKYDMPVEVSVQETLGVVDEDDNERPKTKQRSIRDDSIPCQLDIHASVPPRSNDNSVARPMLENLQGRDESVPG
ncbi:hypothetical protein HID58_006739 [Brassica napus]|uniref:ADP-ribosyl cyclase/cyclic ADP-ribose hydrolase n=1 Tax=Brassica napus TaxID=3708 RepID=A0ABQ8EEV2_BRANA|nr:hypothetical protein HID58_006739 [Brassica napus]